MIDVPKKISQPFKQALKLAQHQAYAKLLRPHVLGVVPAFHQARIFVANHASFFDVGLIESTLALDHDQLQVMGAEEPWSSPHWQRFYPQLFKRLLPASEPSTLKQDLARALEGLAQGKQVLFFAEGSRASDGKIRPFQPALGYLILRAACDVLPLYLENTAAIWPKHARLPTLGTSITIKIGPLLRHTDFAQKTAALSPSAAYGEAARLCQHAVEGLRDGVVFELAQVHARSSSPHFADANLQAQAEMLAKLTVEREPLPRVTVETSAGGESNASMSALLQQLVASFVVGATDKPLSFYLSVGDKSDEKWTILVDAQTCSVKEGRGDGKADCVLKTTLPMLTKIICEHYTPSLAEFANGTVKTNNPAHLKVFKRVFAL